VVASKITNRHWRNKLVTKTDQFHTAQWQIENRALLAKATACDWATSVRLDSSYSGKKRNSGAVVLLRKNSIVDFIRK